MESLEQHMSNWIVDSWRVPVFRMGWTFDDLEESTKISSSSKPLSWVYCNRSKCALSFHVLIPLTNKDYQTHMNEFRIAGFTGAIDFSDATHIAIEKSPHRLWNNHLGPKQHLTAQSFNITVNHRQRILSTTVGYPGRWNDKNVVLFDSFVRGIYDG